VTVGPEIKAPSHAAWRKAILLNRSTLLSAWSRYFPHHSFADLRLISPNPAKGYWQGARMSWTCRGCGQNPCVNPGFCAACDREERAHPRRESAQILRMRRLLQDDGSPERSSGRATPGTTVEAIKQSVRDRGVAALQEPETQERLQRCDAAARADIDAWLKAFKQKIANGLCKS
jgi:hypothetical protein